ncbi:molybdopterin converting factor [Apibacter muscae]|uniref:Molybdopterin converting factor n=1 Tax=Apibacter muscae TaxID=2509004 RepID=A0A563DGA5_9FLAO|nr:MoaD/ThiS family protein [Apibacter muscae]TWP29061.1 molybdopterin converting factor [Apibacter muscae]TWP30358.1 molybdopterin converting factor [Apibacter muscae]
MKIKIFGKLTDIFKTEEYHLDKEENFVIELRNQLEKKFPQLKTSTYLIVINEEIKQDSDTIPENAEIALLPPYSGG